MFAAMHFAQIRPLSPDGAPWTELMPIHYGLWIADGLVVAQHGLRVAHSTNVRARDKAAALRVAKEMLPMFVRGLRGVRVRRARVEDYRDMLAGGYMTRTAECGQECYP